MKTRLQFLTVCAALSLLFGSPVASAQVDMTRHSDSGDYYKFKDDLLSSDVAMPPGDRILVRRMPARVMLIRPRTQFVTEMLKSVEHL